MRMVGSDLSHNHVTQAGTYVNTDIQQVQRVINFFEHNIALRPLHFLHYANLYIPVI